MVGSIRAPLDCTMRMTSDVAPPSDWMMTFNLSSDNHDRIDETMTGTP